MRRAAVEATVGDGDDRRDHFMLPPRQRQLGRHERTKCRERVMEGVRNQRVRGDDAGDVIVNGKNWRFVLGRIKGMLRLTRMAQAVVGLRPGYRLDARHRETSSEASD